LEIYGRERHFQTLFGYNNEPMGACWKPPAGFVDDSAGERIQPRQPAQLIIHILRTELLWRNLLTGHVRPLHWRWKVSRACPTWVPGRGIPRMQGIQRLDDGMLDAEITAATGASRRWR
jgi:hypothetical protein